MFSYRIGFWSVLAEIRVFISEGREGRKVARCHCLISPLCTMRQKCLSGWKNILQNLLNFSNNCLARWCSQSDVSEGVSVPVEIFDYLLHRVRPGHRQLQLNCSSCLRFKYLQNALINLVSVSWVKKRVEDTILHNMTVWCSFNYSFSCRKFFEIWTSSQ